MKIPSVLSRIRNTLRPMAKQQMQYAAWLFTSSERHSISYKPSGAAKMSIAASLAVASGLPLSEVNAAVQDLAADRKLTGPLRSRKSAERRRLAHDDPDGLGKHLFYAAAVRLLRPTSICEIGTYLGYGTTILETVAKAYNARVTTIDHRRYSPRFLEDSGHVRQEIRDVMATDAADWIATQSFDFVIWDAVQRPEAETAIFDSLMRKQRTRIVCANWHASGSLFHSAIRHGYGYLPVMVDPDDHWYRGTQLGFAYTER